MKRMIAAMVAVTAITLFAQSDVNAQDFLGGYRFGAGLQSNCGLGFGFRNFQREQPPYFAQFPPVYYSHIVKRPYGVSPYAAPAGIAPVEMNYVVPKIEPVTKVNPFYKPEVAPVSNEKEEATKKDKFTWSANPFFSNVPSSVAAK